MELVSARARAFATDLLAGGGPELLPEDARRADPERAADLVLGKFHNQGLGADAAELSTLTGRS